MDEYISREEVLSRIYATHSTGGFANEEAYLWLHDAITNLSAEDSEPVKHGRWIIDYAEGRKIYHAHCSECGKEPTRNIGGDYYIDKLSDFCPNCGAKNEDGF